MIASSPPQAPCHCLVFWFPFGWVLRLFRRRYSQLHSQKALRRPYQEGELIQDAYVWVIFLAAPPPGAFYQPGEGGDWPTNAQPPHFDPHYLLCSNPVNVSYTNAVTQVSSILMTGKVNETSKVVCTEAYPGRLLGYYPYPTLL